MAVKSIRLTINAQEVQAQVEPRTHLADFLRESQGLTGTNLGCEHGVCGACTLEIDGAPARSCITFAVACEGATVRTIEACARAVSELAERGLVAMVEPFVSHRVDGRVRVDLSPDATIRAMTVAAGLGTTSAYTWLKVPVVDDMERVMAATTLPALLLGGEVSAAQDAAFERWRKALKLPTVCGLVIGRSLLYPPDDDVAAAVDAAVGLLQEGAA